MTVVFCCLLALDTACAAEVTLEECLKLAARQNSGLKAFEKSKEAAASSKKMNQAALLPSLSMKAHYSLADKPEKFLVTKDSLSPGLPSQDTNLADNRRDNYHAGLYLTQPLFTDGNLISSLKRSDYQLRATEHENSYQITLLFEQVRKTFYELLAANISVSSHKKTLETRQKLVMIAKARQEEGFAGKEDILLASADLADAEARLIAARHQSDLLSTRLHQLTQSGTDEPLVPSGDLMKLRIELPLHDFLKHGDSSRDDIKAVQFKVKQKEAEVGMAKSGYFPNIFLQGAYLRQRDTYITRPDNWSVSVNAEWNIFDWGRTSSNVQRARALNQQEAHQLEELKKSARSEIELFWRQAHTELGRLLSLEARLMAAEHAVEKSMAKRREGIIRQTDLYISEAALWQAYSEYSQSAAILHGIMASLERATTQPMDSWVVRSPLHRPDFELIASRLGAAEGLAAKVREATETANPSPTTNKIATLEAGKVVDASQQEPATSQSVKPQYYIQFGAFSKQVNANHLLNELKARYSGSLKLSIATKDGMHRVVTGYYTDKNSMMKQIHSLRITNYIIKSDRI